jgi:hypothetical protein
MWIMWITAKRPYRWDEGSRLRLDVGLFPQNGFHVPCGKNSDNSSTDLSTGAAVSHQIHILEKA